MKIFKFGGASVKDAEGVKNVLHVLKTVGHEDVLLSEVLKQELLPIFIFIKKIFIYIISIIIYLYIKLYFYFNF